MADKPLKSSCHCGAITVIVPHQPKEINECQCTICRRYSSAWGYYKVDEVRFDIKEGAKVLKYAWGDKHHSFDFCETCGCVCWWWPFDLKERDGTTAVCGINTRNMDPMELLYVNRIIDRAMVLEPVNKKSLAHEQDQAKY